MHVLLNYILYPCSSTYNVFTKHLLSNIQRYYFTESFIFIHEYKISSVYIFGYRMPVTMLHLLCDQDAFTMQRMSVLASGSLLCMVILADLHFAITL